MSAYKCDVVVVIKMGAYIQGVLILCGCLLSRFYGNDKQETLSQVHYTVQWVVPEVVTTVLFIDPPLRVALDLLAIM